MSLSFFRALDPTSKYTGFFYESLYDNGLTEQFDLTISENLHYRRDQNLVTKIFEILVGDHYQIFGPHDSGQTAKGVLDFLIFPLIARNLILGSESIIAGIVGVAIAIPLEIARFSLGIALTLLLTPIVALVNLIKNCLPMENTQSAPSVTA